MKNGRQRGHTNACGGLEILPLGMGIGYKWEGSAPGLGRFGPAALRALAPGRSPPICNQSKFRKPNQIFLKMAPAGPRLNPIKFQNLTFLRVGGVPPVKGR